MLIITATASIIGLTVLVWSINRILPFSICPICAGVSGTWVWLLLAHFTDYQIDLTIPALLLGGTVVGIMSKLEKLIEPKFVLVWKTIFVTAGFLAADSLITHHWLILAGGIIVALLTTITSQRQKPEQGKPDLKNCC